MNMSYVFILPIRLIKYIHKVINIFKNSEYNFYVFWKVYWIMIYSQRIKILKCKFFFFQVSRSIMCFTKIEDSVSYIIIIILPFVQYVSVLRHVTIEITAPRTFSCYYRISCFVLKIKNQKKRGNKKTIFVEYEMKSL